MKIEDLIKILWRRKFYLLLPTLIVPLVALIVSFQITREYSAEAVIYINESAFQHPRLLEFGLKINLEERIPAIKKLMKGEGSLLHILSISSPEQITNDYLQMMSRKKNAMVIELKGPGVARLSFTDRDPRYVKEVVERMAAAYIQFAMLPYQKVGTKLKEQLKRRDEIMNIQLKPKLEMARTTYLEYLRNYTKESPDLAAAEYDYETWKEKIRQREAFIEQKAHDIIPLKADDPDLEVLTQIVVPPTVPIIPVKPNKPKIVLLALVAGMSLGFLLVFLMEFLDHSLKENSEVEVYLKSPVIGRIPRIMNLPM